MRNLKKVLALVLALAMALSVMASAFTAPEYTEEAQAEYDAMTAAQQNAFYVVSALGIVEGFSDGSFRPEENLTRAQFAAMVYRAKTGDVAKENILFSSASVAMFSDAIDTWAIPYVAYAYSAGIVAGYPDGTFKATKAVTGLEAAKMLLTALGYDAEIEGLVGPTFYANTIKLGTAVGLFNGVKGDIYAPATRADAFVMFANALKANTVSYVGGVATPKTETLNSEDIITLGEEGFDLLDVEAILVATEDAALGAYWRNVIVNGAAYGIEYEQYQKAPAGYARFVYRDYVATNAANQGASYYDRLITVALGDQAAKFAELGEKYRLLVTDMSPVFNENEFRVLYGYPVAAANDGYYTVKTGEVNGLAKSVIEKMEARANGVEKDYTIFVNGSAVTFEEAKAYAGKASTAPYKSVDNDNDGTVDALFIYDYTIGTVKAIDGNDVTFVGVGLGKKTIANAAEFAVGDYAAVWFDTDGYYAKKLEVKEANVTGYNADGFTIAGEKKVFGAYADDQDESLVGGNANAITETVYKFVFDGKYIVNVELTENTRYAKYALIDDFDETMNDSYLQYPYIRLYTEDNEYVSAYVKTINGYQIYNYSYFENDLEKYDLSDGALVSYVLDGDYAYIDAIEYDTVEDLSDTFDGNTVDDTFDFIFNRATQTWEGKKANATITMKDTHGVVFVTYAGEEADVSDYRAYYNGEFQPNYYNELEAKVVDGNNDLVVYVQQNGVNFIKAARITFDHIRLGYELPGLPTTRTGDNFVIIKSVDVEKTSEGWVYTYTTYAPWSTGTETYTSVPFAYQQGQPSADTIWNLKTNADGKVTAHVAINVDFDVNNINDIKYPVLEDTAYVTSDGIDMYGYTVAAFNMDVYGNVTLTLADVLGDAPYFASYTLNVSADADVWFFEANDAGKLTAKNWMSYIDFDYNNAPTDKKFVAYVDMNATTQTANRLILVSGAWANTNADEVVTIEVEATYNTLTKEVEIYVAGNEFIQYIDILNNLEVDERLKNVLPFNPQFPASEIVAITLENKAGVWTVKAIKGNDGATLYSNDLEGAEIGLQYAYISADGFNYKTDADKFIAKKDINAIYMYRTYNNRVDLVYSADIEGAYTDDLADFAANGVVAQLAKTDADVKTFEGFYVVKALDGNYVIVLVDNTTGANDANDFPYAIVKDDENVDDSDDKSNQNDVHNDSTIIL